MIEGKDYEIITTKDDDGNVIASKVKMLKGKKSSKKEGDE